MKVQQEWGPGPESLINDLSGAAPAGGVVADPEAWARLWRAWCPGVAAPAVDFRTSLVLVAMAPGPNILLVRELRLTDDGNLRFEYAATERGGSGFVAKMLQVDRRGVRTVNGRPRPAREP